MGSFADNLKLVMTHFAITNSMLSRGLSIDPSLVSRWLNGQRQVRANSDMLGRLVDYILSRNLNFSDVNWFKKQFRRSGMQLDVLSVADLRPYLMYWLCNDKASVHSFLPSGAVSAGESEPSRPVDQPAATAFYARNSADEFSIKIGATDIALSLESLLGNLAPDSEFDIHLSDEGVRTIVESAVIEAIVRNVQARNLKVKLLVSLSSNTYAMSRLITAYLPLIVSAAMQLSVVHGLSQPLTNQISFLAPQRCAILITEIPDSSSPPVSMLVTEQGALHDLYKTFERSMRYAQPVLTTYNDNFSRNILEIFYLEYCMPGDLDVIKDSINPMYMTEAAYGEFLRTCGHRGDKFTWRFNEFQRFKSGMDQTLGAGSVFREIISLTRLKKMLESGVCRMPALYFMDKGVISVGASACVAIMEGYIHYLRTTPNFNLLIVNDIDILNTDSCWHLKSNHHVALNSWDRESPAMIYTDQLILTHEFQTHFNNLWMQNNYSIGGREKTIVTLTEIIRMMKETYLQNAE